MGYAKQLSQKKKISNQTLKYLKVMLKDLFNDLKDLIFVTVGIEDQL